VDRINDGEEALICMTVRGTGVGVSLSRVIFDSLGQKELIRMAPNLIRYFSVSDD